MKLKKNFYLGTDVVLLAKELIGKYLFTNSDGIITGGIITETEAYEGITDKASHAYNNKHTKRTEVMFKEGGIAYVYLCYGIHSLFNVVTNKVDIPHAILIRGIIPTYGIDTIKTRLNSNNIEKYKIDGPGKVTKALGIHYLNSGISLDGNQIWLENNILNISENEIIACKRIGVDYAKEDALLPYRFIYNPSINNITNLKDFLK
jgi:DNA-3-methyladenine glycosylase